MKKNTLQVFLVLALLVALQAQGAYYAAPLYYDTNGDNSVTITSFDNSTNFVTIPSAELLNGVALPVTTIGNSAFASSDLAGVSIPNTVTSIGDGAFLNGIYLTNVVIPDGVTNIGDSAFESTSLTSVTIPGSVTSIGTSVFNGDRITSVTIPDSVTNIGELAFALNPLTNIVIPDGVISIGDFAFESTLITNVTIPNSVTSVGINAFEYSSLTSVTIGTNVTSLGDQAFAYCPLTNVFLPKSVTNIGQEAFGDDGGLTAITVDPQNAFYSSVNGVLFDKGTNTLLEYPDGSVLTNYSVPDGVSNIGAWVFAYASLMSITIPSSVTSIGDFAFYDCGGGQTSLYFSGNAPLTPWVYYPRNNLTAYYLPGTTGWDDFFVQSGIPTAMWVLPRPLILNTGPSFGAQSNCFGFTLSWATNVSVVVEVCTNLAESTWFPVSTNNLTNGSLYFSEPVQTNISDRYYRVIAP